MSVVQNSYDEYHSAGAEGQIVNTNDCTVDSATVEGPTDLGFGLAVQRGATDKSVKVGVAASGDFAGVTVRDPTLPPVNADKYKAGDTASVLARGDIWVKVSAAVNDGDDVTVGKATGTFSSTAADSTNIAVKGAVFLTTAAANGLAQVRIQLAPGGAA